MDADSIDPDGMAGKRVVAKLKIDNRDTEKNQVTLYKPAEAAPVQSQPAVNDAGASVNDGSASRPWNRRMTASTPEAIYRAYEERSQKEKPRGYLGASSIGDPCHRRLWYGFRFATPESFEGRILRLFPNGPP